MTGPSAPLTCENAVRCGAPGCLAPHLMRYILILFWIWGSGTFSSSLCENVVIHSNWMWGSGTFGPSLCENGVIDSNYENAIIHCIQYIGLQDLRPLVVWEWCDRSIIHCIQINFICRASAPRWSRVLRPRVVRCKMLLFVHISLLLTVLVSLSNHYLILSCLLVSI